MLRHVNEAAASSTHSSDIGCAWEDTPHILLERLWYYSAMMKRAALAIADIYVPVKRRATLEQKRVDDITASILDKGLQTPILVRADGARFVLVGGPTPFGGCQGARREVVGFLVEARKH
jgi:hypothetical protein